MEGRGEVRYARSGAISIAHTELGTGPREIVFVPGFVSNLDLAWELPPMAYLLRRLARLGRVVTFDKRGTGLSDRTGHFGSFEERMDDIRAVVDAVGMDRPHLVGISEGGPLAFLFAAAHPERARDVAIFGSLGARGYWAPDYPVGVPADVMERFLDLVGEQWGSGEVMPYFFQHLPSSPEVASFLARYERSACTPTMAVEILRTNTATDIRSLLPTISVPSLLLHNIDDPLLRVGHARYYAEHLPDAQLIERAGDFHVSWRPKDMEWVLDEIERWIFRDEPGGAEPTAGTVAAAGSDQGPAPVLEPPPRLLATVLFTDIVGSTDRAATVGDGAWRRTLDEHDALVAAEVGRRGGRVIKSTGDGALATFERPSGAIASALAIRDGIRASGIEVRAGVHTGEVEPRGHDISGLSVHIAARVADLAEPSEVWVSRTVRDLVSGSGIDFEDRGSHALKGVPDPWEVYAVRGGPPEP